MEKKMTKTQEKEMLKIKLDKRFLRNNLINAANEYWRDIEALERVSKIENKPLTDEYKQKILKNYKDLAFLLDFINEDDLDKEGKADKDLYHNAWTFVRLLDKSVSLYNEINTVTDYDSKLKEYVETELDTLPDASIWCDDIIWNTQELKVYLQLCEKYGIEKLYYTNSSTGALKNISDLIRFNAKVIGTTNISKYRPNEGIIFDITDVTI